MSTVLSNSRIAALSGSGTNQHCPDGWREVRLRDLLVLEQPGAWGDEPKPSDPGVRVLRATDLTRDGRVILSNAAYRRLSERDMDRRLMRDGDLILERSGGGPGAPVGRVALIQRMGPIYCNNFCQQLRVDGNQCSPQFASRVLWHIYEHGVTARLEHQTTGIRNLDYAGYLALPLLLPPLPEQRAIAAILDSIDHAIEATDALVSATEQLRDSLLHNLLTRGLPGHHTEWKQVPGLGTIPADWKAARLGNYCERITKGTTPTTLGRPYALSGVRFLRVENISDSGSISGGQPRFIDGDTHNLLSRSVLKDNDLVLSIAGALGRSALITKDILPANVNQALAIVRLGDRSSLLPAFLSQVLRGQSIQTQVNDMRTELAQANISLQQVADLLVPLVPLPDQQAIVAVLESVDEAIEKGREAAERSRKLKESASDALLTGRVRVKESMEASS